MDWTQIIVALITVIGATVGTLLVNQNEKRKDAEARKEREAKSRQEREAKSVEENKKQDERLENFKADILKTLDAHRAEYLNGIEGVKDNINELRAATQQSQAIIELKIDQLEKKQDKHNNVIERTFKLESDIKLIEQRETASESRLKVLEAKV